MSTIAPDTPTLLEIYDFTPHDLELNRAGKVSKGQREWLRAMAATTLRISRWGMQVGIVIMLLGAGFTAWLFLRNQSSREAFTGSTGETVPILIGCGAFVVFLLVLSRVLMHRSTSALARAPLSKAEGVVKLKESTAYSSSITTYYVILGKTRFKFGDDPSKVFQEGIRYRIYYCKARTYQVVMSYERLG